MGSKESRLSEPEMSLSEVIKNLAGVCPWQSLTTSTRQLLSERQNCLKRKTVGNGGHQRKFPVCKRSESLIPVPPSNNRASPTYCLPSAANSAFIAVLTTPAEGRA